MKCHLFYVPTIDVQNPAEVGAWYEGLVKQSIMADGGGIESIWLAEHHGHRYGGAIPAAEILLAYIAAKTVSLKLGFGVAVLPLRDALGTAERVSMLDLISKHRVNFGIGRGFLNYEFKERGIVNDSWDIFLKNHNVIMTALASGHVQQSVGGLNIDTSVTPRLENIPPVWVAASRHKETYDFAGSHKYNLMINYYTRSPEEIQEGLSWYYEAARRNGHDAQQLRVATIQQVYLGDDYVDVAMPSLKNYLDEVTNAFQLSQQGTHTAEMEKVKVRIDTAKNDDSIYNKVSFGRSERILAQARYLKDIGFTDILYMPHFGDLSWDVSNKTVSNFIREIVPKLKTL